MTFVKLSGLQASKSFQLSIHTPHTTTIISQVDTRDIIFQRLKKHDQNLSFLLAFFYFLKRRKLGLRSMHEENFSQVLRSTKDQSHSMVAQTSKQTTKVRFILMPLQHRLLSVIQVHGDLKIKHSLFFLQLEVPHKARNAPTYFDFKGVAHTMLPSPRIHRE